MSRDVDDVEEQVGFIEDMIRDFFKGLKIMGIFAFLLACACFF